MLEVFATSRTNLSEKYVNPNRGASGKFDRLPSLRMLERLHARNEHLITSHHPLRETLIHQTGMTEVARRDFLTTTFEQARSVLIHDGWEPAA